MPRTTRALVVLTASILIISLVQAPSAAPGPNRLAVAPFTTLPGQDEAKPVAALLPQLFASRLMALAGAEVRILPADKPPADAAREAGIPFLLQGSVTKVGKGYSIDVTVTDLSAAAQAPAAFFAAPATEDEIIPQLGIVAREVAEKVFGIPPAARPAPPPAVQAAAPAAPVLPAAPAAPGGPRTTAPVPAAAPAPAASIPADWRPARIEKAGASDKVPTELYRIASGDLDGDGETELVAAGGRTIFFYKVKGNEVVPFPPTRIVRDTGHHLLNVEVLDADGDGKPEVFVTDLVADRLRSFVLRYRDGAFEAVATDIPWYIVVLGEEGGRPVLAGQKAGFEDIFSRGASYLRYEGGKVTEGKSVGLPLEDGIFGLRAAKVGSDGRYLYIDADEHLRLLDGKGKTLSKTKEYFGRGVDHVTRGPVPRSEVSPKQTWIRGRILPLGGAPESPWLLTRQAEGATVMKESRNFSNSRIVVGRYDGTSFSVRAASDPTDHMITDVAVLPGRGGEGGATVAATVIESSSSVVTSAVSYIFLYRVE